MDASSAKRLRFEVKPKFVQLLDLPIGPLHLILSKVSADKQILLRRASKALRKQHSEFMMHKYRRFVELRLQRDVGEANLNVLMVLVASTEFFITAGYDLVFTGSLICSSDLNQLSIEGKNIDEIQLHQFLYEFYSHVEAIPTILHLKQRRLIYTVTLLYLLRQFKRFRVVSSTMPLLHWKLHLEVCGIFFGIRSDVTTMHISEEEKLIDFLTIIAELLVYDMSSVAGYSRFIEIGECFYIYGRKHLGPNARTPRINLKLSILGPPAVRRLLESVISERMTPHTILNYPVVTESQLNIQLELKTTRHYEAIGTDHMNICIVPSI